MTQEAPKPSRWRTSGKSNPIVIIAIFPVVTALVFVATFSFVVYIPATKGYFNFGDIMIFIVSLTFGPTAGGVAGGLGSALSDALAAPQYAPYTFVIKGIEGYIAGLISRRGFRGSTGTAWLLASIEMVAGYFIAESLAITGYPASLACVPVDILQVAMGGIVGIPVSRLLKTRLPSWLIYLSRAGPQKPGTL